MPTAPAAPPLPFSVETVPWEEPTHRPRFGVRNRHLSRAALGDRYRLGVAIEELAPGRQSAPAHYHVFEEEHVFILEGAFTVRIGAAAYPMGAGDYVCFPAGQAAGHCLVNESGAVCRYVIIGENNPNEVIVYTDSRQMLVRALGRQSLSISRRGATTGRARTPACHRLHGRAPTRRWPVSTRQRRTCRPSPRATWPGTSARSRPASSIATSISPTRRWAIPIASAC